MLSPIEVERLWNTIDLSKGAHEEGSGKACLMNMVAILAGEKQTDSPICACPAITAFAIRINDRAPDDCRQMLKPYAPAIIGTRDRREMERAALFVNAAVKFFTPLALDARGLHEHAAKLRSIQDGDWFAMKEAAYAACAAAGAANAAYAAAYAAYAAADARAKTWHTIIMPKVLELLDAAILIGAPERKAKPIINIPVRRVVEAAF